MTPRAALTGRELRRLTRRAVGAHGGGRARDLVDDVYSGALAAAITVALLIGVANEFAGSLRRAPASQIDPSWLGWSVVVLGLGVALGLAGRLGPLYLPGGYAAWWLTMPADRRGLLRPRLLSVAAVSFLMGAAVGIPATALLGGLRWDGVLAVGAGFTLAAAIAGAAQVRGRDVSTVGDVLVVAGLVPLVIGGVTKSSPPEIGAIGWVAPILLTAAAAVLISVDRLLERLPGVEVRERGLLAAGLQGSVSAFDTRDLGLLLSVGRGRGRQERRSREFRWVRGPRTALVLSEAVHLLRTPRHLVQFAVGMGVALLAAVSGWSVWVAAIGLVIGGGISASALAGPARHAYRAPVIDEIMPLGYRTLRWQRTVLPGVLMAVWAAGVLTLGAGTPRVAWLLLGLLAGPVFAAGAIRAAYRRPIDWSAPLITSPDGQAIPPGAFAAVSVGSDVVLLGGLPLWVALTVTGPSVWVIAAQAATSALALLAATRTNAKGDE